MLTDGLADIRIAWAPCTSEFNVPSTIADTVSMQQQNALTRRFENECAISARTDANKVRTESTFEHCLLEI